MTLYAVYATNEDGSFSWIDSYWLNNGKIQKGMYL